VVYRFYSGSTEYGRFHGILTGPTSVNQVFNVGINATAGSFNGPFGTIASWPGGYVRLRFPANAAVTAPASGPVSIIEYFMPIEWTISVGAPFTTTITTDANQSAGILQMQSTGCTAGVTGCLASPLAVQRTCTPLATGTVSGTALTWDTCSIVPPAAYTATTGTPSAAQLSWNADLSQVDSATNPGCLANVSNVGYVGCSGIGCSMADPAALGQQQFTWDQKMPTIIFTSTNYASASMSFPETISPEKSTYVYTGGAVTAAVASHVECGSAAQITCNEN
jgi:hypothetical protein